ncbi:7TM diverse intracellular signaling domain-containing protein [uncultured Microscilla sp.]|uniref:7TM diverse intracellular signaling domain-containing protein n=1 Tax=uncultured Microscilla sp. TaxID=432653 RepID=UPI002626D7A3|nr:7TM diverse intracellular signaling domain-containing protein [uncultured Microscilla sp.]
MLFVFLLRLKSLNKYLSSYYLKLFFCCAVLLWVAATPILAQAPFVLQQNQTYSPSKQAVYLEDKRGKLTFEQVQNKQFIPSKKASLNFGYTSSAYWVRLRLRNETVHNDWRILSTITYHNSLGFWVKNDKEDWTHHQTGCVYPLSSQGNQEHIGYVFPLDLPKGKVVTVYFRLQSFAPLTFPLELVRKEALDIRFQAENLYYGIYFGILIVMMLYNFFIFITLRDKTYIYYVLYIVCMLIIFSGSTGYLFRYVHPNYPILNLYVARLTMGLIVITTSLFTIHFLDIKKYSRLVYRLFLIDMGLAPVAMLLTGFEIYSPATNTLLSLHSPFLLVAGIVAWRKGHSSARYYVIAWSIFLIGAISITLRNAGVLPVNNITNHLVEVGSAIEIVLLSLALADRYRILRLEKEAATRKALDVQKRATEELEVKVQERTYALQEANEEIKTINSSLERQRDDIVSSITYAQRIQKAMLPSENRMKKYLPEHFVIFRPHSIVSGDFYWFKEVEQKQFVIVADCTGHGVPGAFMTMLGFQAITNTVVQKKIYQPDQILNVLDQALRKILNSEGASIRDGMDIVVCQIDKEKSALHYAGAQNPLILVQDNELREVKGDNYSINGYRKNESDQRQFTLHTFDISTPTTFYVYSDGYQDQFGGEQGRKFMKKRFRQLLGTIAHKPVKEQKQILEATLDEWMHSNGKTYKQIDDVLVMGVKTGKGSF